MHALVCYSTDAMHIRTYHVLYRTESYGSESTLNGVVLAGHGVLTTYIMFWLAVVILNS